MTLHPPPILLPPSDDRPGGLPFATQVPVDTGNGQLLTMDVASFVASATATWNRNRLMQAEPAPGYAAMPAAKSLAQWQTPIRAQQGRDTCWAFAALAALEAAYKRTHNLDLDLSEQYFTHVCRATFLNPDYLETPCQFEDSTSLWGGGGNSGSVASLGVWWVPVESMAPYMARWQMIELADTVGVGDIPWVPASTQEAIDTFEWDDRHVPRAARWNCTYGVTSTEALPDLSIGAIKNALVADHEVVVDILTHIGYDATGRWVYEHVPKPYPHVVVIVGYDDNDQDGTFLVKNSWGGSSLTRVAYSFFTHGDAYVAAHCITGVVPPGMPAQRLAFWLGRWNLDHDGSRGTLVIRRFTDTAHPTKLGNYYRADGTRLDVNGWMDEQGLRAMFWIADNPGRVTPGAPQGQPFTTYVFNGDPGNAAGMTLRSGTWFGAQLSRDPIAATPTDHFDRDSWRGVWDMDHDGWRGTLTIRGFTGAGDVSGVPVDAQYTPVGGTALPTHAVLTVGAEHRMQLTITFSEHNVQPFDLFHHTSEADLFSGITQWGGNVFGAKGHRTRSGRLQTEAQPSSVPGEVATTFTVTCSDRDTGLVVAASVIAGDSVIGNTDEPLTHTLVATLKRVWVPEPGAKPPGHWEVTRVYPTVTVAAPGYLTTVVPLRIVGPPAPDPDGPEDVPLS